MGTILVGLIIAAWVILSVIRIQKSKKEGCGGSCSGCNTKTNCTSNIYEAYRRDHKRPAA